MRAVRAGAPDACWDTEMGDGLPRGRCRRTPAAGFPRARPAPVHTQTRTIELPASRADAGWLNRETDLFQGVESLAILSVSTGFLFFLSVIPTGTFLPLICMCNCYYL